MISARVEFLVFTQSNTIISPISSIYTVPNAFSQ